MAKEIQQAGVRLMAYACDVSDLQRLDQVLGFCAKEKLPIRGVIQAAMVLRVSLPAFIILPAIPKTLLGVKELQLTSTGHHYRHDDPLRLPASNPAQSPKHAQSSRPLINPDLARLLHPAILVRRHNRQSRTKRLRIRLHLPKRLRTPPNRARPTHARALDLDMIESAGYVSENLDSLKFLVAQGFTPVKLKKLLALLNYAVTVPVTDVDSSQLVVGLHEPGQSTPAPKLPRRQILPPRVSQEPTPATGAHGGAEKASGLQRSIPNRQHPSRKRTSSSHRPSSTRFPKVLVVPMEDVSPLRAISSYGGDSLAAVELRNWFVRSIGGKTSGVIGDCGREEYRSIGGGCCREEQACCGYCQGSLGEGR